MPVELQHPSLLVLRQIQSETMAAPPGVFE
jgi:hypothetical protein